MPDSNAPKHHILSVLVENKAGVLARISGLFARRAYNIFSLAVAPTEDRRLSRLTVVVDAESAPLEQVVKQLNKLINVIKITELDPIESVQRELMLIAVRCTAVNRREVIELVQIFDGRILDVGHSAVTFSVDARPDRLDTLEELLRPYGIVDVQRTGRVALPKRAIDQV
jgi:acetolactate synthase-1/3 small subunit